jgi:hypothetical protein
MTSPASDSGDASSTPRPAALPEALSGVLADYSRPALAAVPRKASLNIHRIMLTLAVRVWNECVAEARGTRQDVLAAILKDLERLPEAGRASFAAMAEQLYARKRAHFAADLRYVDRWTMVPTKTGFTLRCEPLAP